LVSDAVFALDFLDSGGGLISSATLSLLPNLFVANGQPFNYKQYSLSATAPANAMTVRARASMIDGLSNPAGGGQAFVVDDFVLIPAPSTGFGLALINVAVLGRRRRRNLARA